VANISAADSGTNLTWVVTNDADAKAGLADGTYAAVVTIPADFSAAATSPSDAATVRQATLSIATSDRSRPLDAILAQAVTDTASSVLGHQLTATYLQNVFVGFDTLGTSLGKAADGANQLADGASGLSTGAGQLATGTGTLTSGLSSLGSGASSRSSGVGKLSSGASSLAGGLDQLAAQTRSAASTAAAGVTGAQQFAAGLDQLATGVNGTSPSDVHSLSYGTKSLATGTSGVADGASGLSQGLAALKTVSAACQAGSTPSCTLLTQLLDLTAAPSAGDPAHQVPANLSYLVAAAGSLSTGAAQTAAGASALSDSVNTGTSTTPALTTSTSELAAAGHQIADGTAKSADGLSTIAAYLQQSASGAHQLAAGASSAMVGAGQLSAGASQAASGAGQLTSGATSLADGAGQLSTGATSLASGLTQATDQLPSYSTAEADRLASVVADPVATDGGTTEVFGPRIVPYLVVLALWLGGLATFLVLGPLTPRALGSTRPSWQLALRSFAPAAVVGVVQGVALTAVMAPTLVLTPGGWVRFTVVACLAGVSFAAVNQGIAAALRGIGRFLAVLLATIGLASAVISTVPAMVGSLYAGSPLGPALAALQSVTGAGSIAGPVALLVIWGLGGLALTTAALARHRVIPAGQLARWSRAA
jgi:putative membrane protein